MPQKKPVVPAGPHIFCQQAFSGRTVVAFIFIGAGSKPFPTGHITLPQSSPPIQSMDVHSWCMLWVDIVGANGKLWPKVSGERSSSHQLPLWRIPALI